MHRAMRQACQPQCMAPKGQAMHVRNGRTDGLTQTLQDLARHLTFVNAREIQARSMPVALTKIREDHPA